MDIFTTYFAHALVLSALAVVGVQQILKLKLIPIAFANRYPVPTLILLSIATSIIAVWRTALAPHAWTDWVVLVALVAVTAALTYRTTIANWSQLRAMEGEK
jgi:hypothetical protein